MKMLKAVSIGSYFVTRVGDISISEVSMWEAIHCSRDWDGELCVITLSQTFALLQPYLLQPHRRQLGHYWLYGQYWAICNVMWVKDFICIHEYTESLTITHSSWINILFIIIYWEWVINEKVVTKLRKSRRLVQNSNFSRHWILNEPFYTHTTMTQSRSLCRDIMDRVF
jgi:hypothetical protein